MFKKSIILFILFFVTGIAVFSQELQAKVTVLSNRIGSTVDKRIFTTLQTQLNNLMNTRKWTTDQFQPGEKNRMHFYSQY